MKKTQVKKAIMALEKGAVIIGEPRRMNFNFCAMACLEKGLDLEKDKCYPYSYPILNRFFSKDLVNEIQDRFEGWQKFKNEPQTIPQIVEALNRKLRYSRTLK